MIAIVPEGTEQPAPVYDIQHFMRPGTLRLPSLPPLSLYVHLPWCLKKCPYCDFNSHGTSEGELPEARYSAALLADLDAAQRCIARHAKGWVGAAL